MQLHCSDLISSLLPLSILRARRSTFLEEVWLRVIRGPTESEPSLGSVLPWTVGPDMTAAFTSFVPGVNIPSKCHSLLPKLRWLHSIQKPKPNPCPHASGPSECTFPLLQGASRPPEVSLVPGLLLRTLFPVLRDACTSPCLKPIQFKFTVQGPPSRAL